MKRLGLLRHAKSDWGQAGLADFDRPLNTRGRAAAEALAPILRAEGFELVLASTARRVRETLAPADLNGIEWRDSIYGAAPSDLLRMVGEVAGSVDRLLVVGHNPTMFMLANRLAANSPGDERRLLSETYPTGALALIDLDTEKWTDLADGRGTLARFVRPRDL